MSRNFWDLADLWIFHHSGELFPVFPRVLFVPQSPELHTGGAGSALGWDGRTILLDEGAPSITCSHPRGSWSSSAVPFLHKALLGVVAPSSHSRRSCQDSRKLFQGLDVVVLPLWCLKVCSRESQGWKLWGRNLPRQGVQDLQRVLAAEGAFQGGWETPHCSEGFHLKLGVFCIVGFTSSSISRAAVGETPGFQSRLDK